MKLLELFDMCVSAIRDWNAGVQIAETPTVMLALPRDTAPKGDGVRLLGKGGGPVGRIATIRDRPDGGYDVVAYFPAAAIVAMLKKQFPDPPLPQQESQ